MPPGLGSLGTCIEDLIAALGLLALPAAPLLWFGAPALAVARAVDQGRRSKPAYRARRDAGPYRRADAPPSLQGPASPSAARAALVAGAAAFVAALWLPLGLSLAPRSPSALGLASLGVVLFAELAGCSSLLLCGARGAAGQTGALGLAALGYVVAAGALFGAGAPGIQGRERAQADAALLAQGLSAAAALVLGAIGALLLLALAARGAREAPGSPVLRRGRALPLALGALSLAAAVAHQRFLLDPAPCDRVQASR